MPVKAQTSSLDNRWQAVFDIDNRYYSWTSSRGFPPGAVGPTGSGSQFYMPFGLSVTGTPTNDYKLEFAIRSGYVSSSQTTVGQSGTYSGMVDTSLAGTYTYLALNGVQPFLSLTRPIREGAVFWSD